MGVMNIVIVVFILLIVIYLLVNAFSKTSKLTKMADGKLLQTIPAKDLKNSNNSSNYTYSMWLFIRRLSISSLMPIRYLRRYSVVSILLKRTVIIEVVPLELMAQCYLIYTIHRTIRIMI